MKFLLLFFLSLNLFGAGFWTLSGVEKANIYVQNEIGFLEEKTLISVKTKMKTMLQELHIKTEQQDSPTLMVALKSLDNEDDYYVYVQLSLGEEVQTFRADKTATFALTYDSSDFIETDTDTLDKDVLESVDFLLSQFQEQYEDDKE